MEGNHEKLMSPGGKIAVESGSSPEENKDFNKPPINQKALKPHFFIAIRQNFYEF